MDLSYVYCFKSVGSYKHKLSRIESLVILYWGINCNGVHLNFAKREVNIAVFSQKCDLKVILISCKAVVGGPTKGCKI